LLTVVEEDPVERFILDLLCGNTNKVIK
jgi:hypothetical protein